MANWDVPDYDVNEVIDYEGLHQRIRKEDPNAMLSWPIREYPVRPSYSRHLVQDYCVHNAQWQRLRLSLKGKPTHVKLRTLKEYWDKQMEGVEVEVGRKPEKLHMVEIQVGNYLGALRRGGQLDGLNKIRKYL